MWKGSGNTATYDDSGLESIRYLPLLGKSDALGASPGWGRWQISANCASDPQICAYPAANCAIQALFAANVIGFAHLKADIQGKDLNAKTAKTAKQG